MSSGMTTATANNVIDATLGTASFTAVSGSIRCRLMTANGSAGSAGTELGTSAGYTGGTGAPVITFASASSGSAASNSAYNVTNMPANTITGVELWDGTPTRKWWGALAASKTVNSGDTFSIASGSLTVSASST